MEPEFEVKSVWMQSLFDSYTKQVFVLCIIPKEIKKRKRKNTISKVLRFRNSTSILSKAEVQVYSLGYSLTTTCVSCSSSGKAVCSAHAFSHGAPQRLLSWGGDRSPSALRQADFAPHAREEQPSCSDHGESQTNSLGRPSLDILK